MASLTYPLSWLDRWYAWRDRKIASAKFQRFAANFPLTRPFVRKSSRALFDICAGFIYTQILLSCVRLNLFQILAAGPQDLATLARRLDLPMDAAKTLLEAAASLDLVNKRGGENARLYGLGQLGAAMLGNPGIAAMVEHHALVYRDWADPVAMLKAGPGSAELGQYWAYANTSEPAAVDAGAAATYSALMSASQNFIADDVLDSYNVSQHRHMLDLGGGEGVFALAASRRAANLQISLLDLPAVAERANAGFAKAGILGRAQAVGGDFFVGPLPADADLITLIRVIYDHQDTNAMQLLRAAFNALPMGGRLLLAEPMAETSGAEPIGAAYFGFYLWAMGGGRSRSQAELGEMLSHAGFGRVRALRTKRPLLASVLLAEKTA